MKVIRAPLKTVTILVCISLLSFPVLINAQKRGSKPKPVVSKAAGLVDEADKLASEHKFAEAIEIYKLAIRVDPNYARAFGGLGDAYFYSGDGERALTAFKEQVRLAPSDAQAYFDLGYYFNAMGRHGEAFAPLVKAISLDPSFAEAFYEIGFAYLRGDDFEKSIPFFKNAIQLKPDYSDAYYGLGHAYIRLGKTDLAKEQQRKLGPVDAKLASKLEREIPATVASNDRPATPATRPIEQAASPVIQKPVAPVVVPTTPPIVAEVQKPQIVDRPRPNEPAQDTALPEVVREARPQAKIAEQTRQLVATEPGKMNNRQRFALVIGNGAYTSAPPLKNPANDARDMSAMLKTLGFEVTTGLNANQREMKRLIREFGSRLKTGGAGVFYYAGHGVQAKGHNYLIPIDAEIQNEPEVEDFGVDVNLVLNFMDDAQNGVNIVILDACRDNPFARSFRSAINGLAPVDAPTGTLIAYATAPGRVASDGSDRNGLYTSALLKQLPAPVSVSEMFMRVRAEVMKVTANKQVPWEASSLVGAFYFSGPPESAASSKEGLAPTESKVDPAAFELSYWDSIKNSADPEDFRAYLEKYPHGHFAVLANNKLRQLASMPIAAPMKAGVDNTIPPAMRPAEDGMPGAKSFEVKNGARRTNGILEVSPAGLRFREVGGKNDFSVPCSAVLGVTINTSWASTVFHKLHIKVSLGSTEKQVDLDGKDNRQLRDFIVDTCKVKAKQ